MTPSVSLTKDVIEAQLARLLESRQFRNAPRLSRFLSYLVEESLAGRLDRLKGYTIGVDVFDRPTDFDPQADTIVRVQARALRLKLDRYYAHDGAADPVRISIAKGSYEPSFFRPSDARSESAGPGARAPAFDRPSIIVLPFDDFSQRRLGARFAEGLTEEIIADLSRFRELTVLSRATASRAKLDRLSIPRIHARFGPDFVLEGSCRIAGDAILITIHLVVAARDEIILTQHFNRPNAPGAMYAVQDEIAAMIAARIADRFGPLDRYARRAAREEQSLKWNAFHWISKYHQYGVQLTPEERAAIRTGLMEVIETDPYFSDAHAVLALIALDQVRVGFDDVPADPAFETALAFAERAVSCDPENASAQTALAVAQFHRRAFDLFAQTAEIALALEPGHAETLGMLGTCFGFRMDWERAMPLLDRALDASPLQPAWFNLPKAIGLAVQGEPSAAVARMRLLPLPGLAFYQAHLVWLLAEAQDPDAARREADRLLDALPDFERVILGHCRAWCLDDRILARAVRGWESAGLRVGG